MTQSADIAALAAAVKAHLVANNDHLHALVNNAGMMKDEWTPEVFAEHMAANTRGPVELSQALLSALHAGHGRVVTVSSGYGSLKFLPAEYVDRVGQAETIDELLQLPFLEIKDGAPKFLAYKVSKAAVNRAVRLMAADAAWGGVPISAVCPGWVRTDMGGPNATRSLSEGVASIRAMLDLPDPMPSGTFTRDGKPLDWFKGSD